MLASTRSTRGYTERARAFYACIVAPRFTGHCSSCFSGQARKVQLPFPFVCAILVTVWISRDHRLHRRSVLVNGEPPRTFRSSSFILPFFNFLLSRWPSRAFVVFLSISEIPLNACKFSTVNLARTWPKARFNRRPGVRLMRTIVSLPKYCKW